MKACEYLYTIRKETPLVTGIFIISIIGGAVFTAMYPAQVGGIIEKLKEQYAWTKTATPFQLFINIFINNAEKSFLAMVLGLGLGTIPILFVIGNGIIIGMVAYTAEKQYGIIFILAALLPHGIIEIPMVLLSAAIGVRLGWTLFEDAFIRPKPTGEGLTDLKNNLIEGTIFFLTFIIPMLLLASFIESFITPTILVRLTGI